MLLIKKHIDNILYDKMKPEINIFNYATAKAERAPNVVISMSYHCFIESLEIELTFILNRNYKLIHWNPGSLDIDEAFFFCVNDIAHFRPASSGDSPLFCTVRTA